ncbi:MAG TPA: S8 family serine peptidase [Gemmatimonadales bacterium]|nr:S8 family serine peptidase [Gemmatimonadales bacterium]
MTSCRSVVVGLAVLAACGGPVTPRPATTPSPQPPPAVVPPPPPAPSDATAASPPGREPALPPAVALMAGLMPLKSTGADEFRIRHPTYDGRGVLIAILDTGIDPGVDGMITTSTGAPKIVELRDFSGEGRVALSPVTPAEDGTVSVGGQKLAGAGRIGRLTRATTWYAGLLHELPLGKLPASDLNGDGNNTDAFPVIVVKATDGWVAFIDSNLNGSFEDEMPLHDYREGGGRETIALGSKPITLAANFSEAGGVPALDFFFDNGGHGTHVAGIAAGHNLFNLSGFDGVAPGAQLLGLKIANAARGGISVTGSMERAMKYAAQYAEQRNLPLVLNLSFGVGNEREGHAVIDSIVNAFLVAHPDVVFTISAGNDGPGLSTVGFPGSADLALSVGASYPGAFARPPQAGMPAEPDVMGWWSSRGGELAKPDLVTPGVAFSSVPRWDTANEVKGGTSMAAPHAAGLAACLLSAMQQSGRRVSAADVMQALRASAVPLAGETVIDEGAGLPRLEAAYRWLVAGHQGSAYVVRAAGGASAAFRSGGLAGPGDTVQLFRVRHAAGLRAAEFLLRSNVPWLSVAPKVPAGARETEIPVTYTPGALTAPGEYVGVVRGWNPSDTLAGPLFTLANTVAVPWDLSAKPLFDERRAIGPARVQRYFLRVANSGATLGASITLPDSAQQGATGRLYEPGGQPFRDAEEVTIGRTEPGTARFVVRAEDLVPGVYELDVFAPPLSAAVVTVRAAVAPLALGEPSGTVEATNTGDATAAAQTSMRLVGAERDVAVSGRGGVPESVTVRVPDWAARAVVDVVMPREQWDDFTDFGVTDFDSAGQQVGQGALNYALGRHTVTVPPTLRGHPVTVELFPAFARANGTHPWRASVRVRFLLEEPRSLGGEADVTVVPGGRVAVPLPKHADLPLPDDFAPLAELRVRPKGGGPGLEAIRRVMLRP